MAKKQETLNISACEAIKALEAHLVAEMHWKMKAVSLLQMVGMKGADQEKLKQACHEHAESGLNPN